MSVTGGHLGAGLGARSDDRDRTLRLTARGFDVWAFTALPLMLGTGGMMLSSVISIGVISYLVSDSAA